MIKIIEGLAVSAGELIIEGFNSNDKKVSNKGRIDLVTKFDTMVELVLKDQLAALFPNHKIVAEESTDTMTGIDGDVIYIDPIDGTTNFVHGFPFVSISIGVYTGGRGQYGVVYNPIMNELFSAEDNKGACLNGEKISVSKTRTLDSSLCATGFPYVKDNLPGLMKILEKVLETTRGVRRAGSAALDLCYTAKGVFDLYYETKLKPWDVAAGIIILKEAGGLVTKFDGSFHDLKSDALIASNKEVHKEFLQLLNR